MIKKICYMFFVLLFVFIAVYGWCENPCKNMTLQNLQNHLPGPLPPGSKIISQKNRNGLCEIIVNIRGRDIPFYATKDYVVIGQMFKNRKNLTLQTLNFIGKKIFHTLKKKLDKVAFFSYSSPHSKTKHTIYFFTDPLCPFCHRTLKKLKGLAKDTNSIIKVVFSPVHIPEGKIEAEKVICSNMDFDTFINTKFPLKGIQVCKKGRELVNESLVLSKELNINGVPTFILEDGTKITGANIVRVKQAINHLPSQKK